MQLLDLEFSTIPKGEFIIGSDYYLSIPPEQHPEWYKDESPMHPVSFTSDFELSKFEITNRQFKVFVENTDYETEAEVDGTGSYGKYNDSTNTWGFDKTLIWKNLGFEQKDDTPVVHVSWNDANAFCRWLNSIDSKYDYALPTEAEWEYAAGFSGKNKYAWGNDIPNAMNGGNIADATFKERFPKWKYPVLLEYEDRHALLSPVGSFNANPFGLYDMTGNVWEWVSDTYAPYTIDDSVNPEHKSNAPIQEKVIRGGGFDWEMPFLRVSKRRKLPLNKESITTSQLKYTSAINVGFRIKRTKR